MRNVYKDPKTGHKIKLMSPPLALGQAVHEVVESLSELKVMDRFEEPLLTKFDRAWKKVTGKLGGFWDKNSEYQYRQRGEEMLTRINHKPGPVAELAVKIQDDLPQYWMSEEDNIILCGKIDWLKYIPEDDSVEIVDFKTSRNEEGKDSLQLPIYHLLVHNCQKRKVRGAWYWYLERDEGLIKKELPNLEESEKKILEIAKKIKLARQLQHFKCPGGADGCRACRPYEKILKGEAEMVGVDGYRADVYVIKKDNIDKEKDAIVL